MSLISILLIATAVLCLLTGFISLVGSSRSDRGRGAWFFVTTIGCAIWTTGIGMFSVLAPGADNAAIFSIYCIYLGSILMAVSVLGYAAWRHKSGKVITIFCMLFGVFLACTFLYDQNLLYSGYTLDSVAGNSVQLKLEWYYISYCVFYIINNTSFIYYQYQNAKRARTKNIRKGNQILFFGLLVAGVLAIVFDLLIPPFDYSLIWVGPLLLSLVMIAFFYATIKYHMISISTRWMQIFAYGVLLSVGAIIYMLLFYIVFTALFKIPNPSASILVLNFLMIIIVLLLMPVLNELNAQIRSMISVGQVNMAYVLKKLNRLASHNIDLRELAEFLADHLHFDYIGFIINGRLYGSKSLSITSAELSQIIHMRQTAHGVWQEPNKTVQKTFDELGLKAAAELRNAKGKTFGQLIVGKPLGKTSFERRDLIQLEMIINLVATVIDSEKHIRA